jgi:hypothetical protein
MPFYYNVLGYPVHNHSLVFQSQPLSQGIPQDLRIPIYLPHSRHFQVSTSLGVRIDRQLIALRPRNKVLQIRRGLVFWQMLYRLRDEFVG